MSTVLYHSLSALASGMSGSSSTDPSKESESDFPFQSDTLAFFAATALCRPANFSAFSPQSVRRMSGPLPSARVTSRFFSCRPLLLAVTCHTNI